MARNPSIHVTKSDLVIILQSVMPQGTDCKGMAATIFVKAIPFNIKNRFIVKGDAVTKKKAEKLVQRKKSESSFGVENFNALLYGIRMERGVKHQQKLHKGTNEWNLLSDIYSLADDFVSTFEISNEREGFKSFIELGLTLMGKAYALNKFKFYTSHIHKAYEAKILLETDETPDNSKRFWIIWQEVMIEYAGKVYDITTSAEKFMPMVYGKMEADEAEADYEDWIVAQFEGLAFHKSLPEPAQFYGPNAKLRWEKYMANKGSTKNTQRKEMIEQIDVGVDAAHIDYFHLLKQTTSED